LARGLQAELYENFTDVSAIYAVNPSIVPHPKSIEKMTYREMRELSYAGFAVFHDEAIIPVIEANIPINVKNTNDPTAPGTLIVPNQAITPTYPVTGIANDDRFAALYLHRYLLNREVGFTLKILQILASYNVSYEHMPSGIDDMTIIFDKSQLTPTIKAHISHDLYQTIAPDELEWLDDYAIIMIVGEGMQRNISTLNKITDALAQANINLPMVNQGASQISTMLGVPVDQMNEAVKVIYEAVF
jgi:aspartate kinase